MKKLLILNSPILTGWGEYSWEPLTLRKAQELARATELVSAVGHEGTASFLTGLLGVKVPVNRIRAQMPEDGQMALVLRLKERLPEGKVLSEEELQKVDYDLGLLSYRREGR